MSKRIYIENNYIVIAENTDVTIDKRNVTDNVYIEKDADLFTFYRKSDNEIIESIRFANILDIILSIILKLALMLSKRHNTKIKASV